MFAFNYTKLYIYTLNTQNTLYTLSTSFRTPVDLLIYAITNRPIMWQHWWIQLKPFCGFCKPVPTSFYKSFFWLTWVEPGVVFCCCRESASRFDLLCVLRCFLLTIVIKTVIWVTLTALTSQVILLWPFALWCPPSLYLQNCHLLDVFCFTHYFV